MDKVHKVQHIAAPGDKCKKTDIKICEVSYNQTVIMILKLFEHDKIRINITNPIERSVHSQNEECHKNVF